MFKWIQENYWLPTLYVALAFFLVLGGLDLALVGAQTLIPGGAFALAIFFARRLPWLSIFLVVAGETAGVLLGLTPTFSALSVACTLLVIAAFGAPVARAVAPVVFILVAGVVIWLLSFGPFATFSTIGVAMRDDQRFIAFLTVFVLTAGWLSLAWLIGRLAFVRMEHVGSPMDRALTLLSQARLNFELSRQNERMEIVRDLSELLIQRVGAVLSLTEGGSYAVKQNPEVASRVLERASEAARGAQIELRRLFDLLHTEDLSGGLTPRLADLDALVIAYRELGYNAELRIEGDPFALDQGAEMCLYKIIFESLENVKKHAPRGTNVTVEFTWIAPGLQLMIKDNGFETSSRSQVGDLIDGYGFEEDLTALVQQIDGATLGAMRERASLYEGTVEATEEPGVGFTIAAIFPRLMSVLQGK